MAFKKRINGSIDSYGWFRWNVQQALSDHKNEEVHLIIMSPGGVVNEAIAISDLLADHGNVTVEFSGLAASAATWLAFGAKRVIMHEDTLWLCHKSSTTVDEWARMNADELDALIEKLKSQQKNLEVIDAIIAKKYLDRCAPNGKTLQQVVDLMKEERYLPAAECLTWGFVDDVLPTKASSTEDSVKISNEFLNAIHLPAVERVEEPEAQAAENPTFIENLARRIVDVFRSRNAEDKAVPSEEEKQQPITIMKKDFKLINALLGVEGVEVAEDKATLTVDQLTAIEARLKELDEAENRLDEVNAKVKGMTGIANKVAAVTLMLDRAPIAPVQVTKSEESADDTVAVEGGDDVTDFAKTINRKN